MEGMNGMLVFGSVIFVMGYDFLLVPLPLDAQGGIEGGLESRVFFEL